MERCELRVKACWMIYPCFRFEFVTSFRVVAVWLMFPCGRSARIHMILTPRTWTLFDACRLAIPLSSKRASSLRDQL